MSTRRPCLQQVTRSSLAGAQGRCNSRPKLFSSRLGPLISSQSSSYYVQLLSLKFESFLTCLQQGMGKWPCQRQGQRGLQTKKAYQFTKLSLLFSTSRLKERAFNPWQCQQGGPIYNREQGAFLAWAQSRNNSRPKLFLARLGILISSQTLAYNYNNFLA